MSPRNRRRGYTAVTFAEADSSAASGLGLATVQ
jgi:hypothetical protein